jgi:hypothetical protein
MSSVCAASAPDVSRPEPKRVEPPPGIAQFNSPPVVGIVDGNAIAILTDRDVVLFDGTPLSASADAVLAELRQLTPNPVALPREFSLAS